ncbi:actin-like ATPase domain-containing protein [Bimuria novae-zelandiae CBS 107.79]|uniref:Actin-like ATPase domain-containing protein n=1 Tax=Bimuria novae-zelandiae CBS 107.79 TaxID=1447943 RepID=A0A6A5VWY3_9PLEO|nr:actin-like ATPase domain-containing protein [Bimuria novae-zelandiae CBS 107.79]
MLGNRLVIGLDYGTTYTGVSFCETSDTNYVEDRIQVVQDWPSAHSMIGTKEKVPSEIAYTPDGIRWGGLIPPHVQRNMWTKLELDAPMAEEAEIIRQELALLSMTGGGGGSKKAVDIVIDYLAEVKKHLVKHLDSQYGPELWRTLPITLVVTVPAVWSDAAKHKTLLAVSRAGFNTVHFPQLRRTVTATEPEAAAIYTIKTIRGTVQDEQLAVGDGFVVCDMGGGTVDLIVYRVAAIEPTIVEEVTIGTGAQCGGTFVDRAFLQWLEEAVGTDDFIKIAGCPAAELSRTSLPPKLGRMVQEFVVTAKSGFSGCEEAYLRLPAPLSAIDDEDRGMCDGEIRIFEFPLRRTKELVEDQILRAQRTGKAKVKYVFMVGGFAESPYMHKEIAALALGHGVGTIRPPYAWSAIARGAAAKGLEGDGRTPIKSRICRRHYGTRTSQLFDKHRHLKLDAYICSFTGEKRATGQMDWLINKGQELAASEKDHGKLYLVHQVWANQAKVLTIPLSASDKDKAPTRSADPTVYTVTDMVIDLSPVPKSEWRSDVSPDGRAYCSVDIVLEISVQSALEYSLSVNGKRYASVEATYA